VYGDPNEHPQAETYWGHVNPIGKILRVNTDFSLNCSRHFNEWHTVEI